MGEALLLCLVGSLYPVALLAVLTYLGSARPLPTAAAFLAGGVVISFITGTALVVLFRQFNVDPDHRPTLSGGVNIGLGHLAGDQLSPTAQQRHARRAAT